MTRTWPALLVLALLAPAAPVAAHACEGEIATCGPCTLGETHQHVGKADRCRSDSGSSADPWTRNVPFGALLVPLAFLAAAGLVLRRA